MNLPDRLDDLAPDFRGAGLPLVFIRLGAKSRTYRCARTVPSNHQACSSDDFRRHSTDSPDLSRHGLYHGQPRIGTIVPGIIFPILIVKRMDLKEVMALNLRRVRHDKAMTQEELAARADLSARYVGSIERAGVSASVTVLGQLADALGVSPCALICRSPDAR